MKKAFAYIFPLLIISYSLPRWIVALLGRESPWTSYFYLYGFGGLFFGCGLLLVLKSRSCVFGRGRDRRWFFIMVSGFLFYATLHATWIHFAVTLPYKGPAQ